MWNFNKQLWRSRWLLALPLLVGCSSGQEIASVEGTVTMDGQPLPNAAVIFVPEGGRPAAARTDDQGHYELNFSGGRKGAIPGKNRVRITTATGPSEDDAGNPVPGAAEIIPVEYNQQTTLEVEVVEGEQNVHDFELVSGGQVVTDDGY